MTMNQGMLKKICVWRRLDIFNMDITTARRGYNAKRDVQKVTFVHQYC